MFEKLINVFVKPKYLFIGIVIALLVGWLYLGPLTDTTHYDTLGWIFAVAFPLLVGAIAATQVYNLSESKTCPANANSGGVIGGILGIVTVACPMCPAVLLSWIGLGAALPGTLLGGPWLKVISLGLLGLSLYWATEK